MTNATPRKNRTDVQPIKNFRSQAVDGLRDLGSRFYLMRSQLNSGV